MYMFANCLSPELCIETCILNSDSIFPQRGNMSWTRCLVRCLLYVAIGVLWCIWTLISCFLLSMAACTMSFLLNCGGGVDWGVVPWIMKKSVESAVWAWQCLSKLVELPYLEDDVESARPPIVVTPAITPPPPAVIRGRLRRKTM